MKDKNETIKTNFRKFVWNEVDLNVQRLTKFLHDIMTLDCNKHGERNCSLEDYSPNFSIMWDDYDYLQKFCFEFIEPEEYENLLTFYRELEIISEYTCYYVASRDNIGGQTTKIEKSIELGKKIMKDLNK